MISFRRVSLFCLAFLSFRAQTALCVRCVYLALKHSDFIKIYKVLTYLTYLVKCYSPNIQIQTCWVIFRPETSTYLESLALLWIQIQLYRLRKCTTSIYETHTLLNEMIFSHNWKMIMCIFKSGGEMGPAVRVTHIWSWFYLKLRTLLHFVFFCCTCCCHIYILLLPVFMRLVDMPAPSNTKPCLFVCFTVALVVLLITSQSDSLHREEITKLSN